MHGNLSKLCGAFCGSRRSCKSLSAGAHDERILMNSRVAVIFQLLATSRTSARNNKSSNGRLQEVLLSFCLSSAWFIHIASWSLAKSSTISEAFHVPSNVASDKEKFLFGNGRLGRGEGEWRGKVCSRSRSRVTQERRELLRSRGARVASPTHDALKRLFANSLGKHISNESSSEAARKLCQQRLIEHCMTAIWSGRKCTFKCKFSL